MVVYGSGVWIMFVVFVVNYCVVYVVCGGVLVILRNVLCIGRLLVLCIVLLVVIVVGY